MLEIINNLAVFFEDCYRWISVREYSRIAGISPPTTSLLLKKYAKEGYMRSKEERRHLLFQLNNEHKDVIALSRIYWQNKLAGLCKTLAETRIIDGMILFGSLAKAEAAPTSDVDLAVFSTEKPDVDLLSFQKKLGRTISIHWFKQLRQIKNEHLLNNVLNGAVLYGKVKW